MHIRFKEFSANWDEFVAVTKTKMKNQRKTILKSKLYVAFRIIKLCEVLRNVSGNPELVVVGGDDKSQWTEILSFCDWTFRLGITPPVRFAVGSLVRDGSSAVYIFAGQIPYRQQNVQDVYHYDHKAQVYTRLERKKAEARSHECVVALDEV